MPDYSLETFYRVYDDQTKKYLQINPNTNSLQLIEIRKVEDNGQTSSVLVLTPKQARLLAQALEKSAQDSENGNGNS